mgnify:CR=1 FL=1
MSGQASKGQAKGKQRAGPVTWNEIPIKQRTGANSSEEQQIHQTTLLGGRNVLRGDGSGTNDPRRARNCGALPGELRRHHGLLDLHRRQHDTQMNDLYGIIDRKRKVTACRASSGHYPMRRWIGPRDAAGAKPTWAIADRRRRRLLRHCDTARLVPSVSTYLYPDRYPAPSIAPTTRNSPAASDSCASQFIPRFIPRFIPLLVCPIYESMSLYHSIRYHGITRRYRWPLSLARGRTDDRPSCWTGRGTHSPTTH